MTSCGCGSRAVVNTIDHRLSFRVTMPLRMLEDLSTDANFPAEQFERLGRPAAGRNRTQSPPKHGSHAHRKTYCHGGVGMNRTQGRPPVRLIQLQSARSAPKQAPDFAPGTVARSTFTTTPPPVIPTKAGKGIRTLDIQLGNQHPR